MMKCSLAAVFLLLIARLRVLARNHYAAGVAVRQCVPMKSGLPRSTPLWRRIAYVVVTWKYTFGST